jgi:hypothetical protein
MQTRRFGRTNHHSTIATFGAAALWSATQPEADAMMEQIIAAGVNHTAGDRQVLPLILRACQHYRPMSPAEQESLIASAGQFEPLFV